MPRDDAVDDAITSLKEMGLIGEGETITVDRLSGGVSCDVWRVRTEHGADMVVKRALPKLRVSADWHAPVERSSAEVAWIRLVAKLNTSWVPHVLGEDRTRHLFVMEYLPTEHHPVWKDELAAGSAAKDFAGKTGAALARVHAATAGSDAVAGAFAHHDQFMALRLDPYLLFAAARHPELAGRISALADSVARARIALMQGDISPKNILCGPEGPVFLDAETACYGDPAFDLAFCLNHLLLKSAWHPEHRALYDASVTELKAAYLAGVNWEDAEDIDARTAALLPALLLARIDGKSPVEYLTREDDKARVRDAARAMLKHQPATLDDLLSSWAVLR